MRCFTVAANRDQHLNSRIHRGADMACPFCKGKFATATGVAHHVERGSCPQAAQINRDELYKFIRAKDPQGLISKKLIGWTGSSQYEASDRAWNGYAYECYLCHRDFSQLRGLNQHLNSPTRKLYQNNRLATLANTAQTSRSSTTARNLAVARTLSVWLLSSTIWRVRLAAS